MKQSIRDGTARRTKRLETFIDGVLAIAITLPIVELRVPAVPTGGDLAGAYRHLDGEYLAYLLSFVVIGLYWAHSTFSGKVIRKADHIYNLLTLLFLSLVSLTPFPVRPFVEHWADPANIHAAATVYTALLAAPSVAWLVRWGYAVRAGLLDPRLDPAYVRQLTRRHAWTVALEVLGYGLAVFVDGRLGFGVTGLATLSYLLPPAAPRYRPGQAPENELEEPGDESAATTVKAPGKG